jgi:hypothetical protein
MNENQIKQLQTLVQAFEASEAQEDYDKLAKWLDEHVPNFREVYFQVSSSSYYDFASAE